MADNSYHDGNHTAVLMAVSSVDGKTPVLVWADPTTHRLLVTSSGSATVYTETPTGAIDGVNTSYTTAHNITTIYSFAINGQYLHPRVAGVGDYTFSGSTITFAVALPSSLSGTPFTIVYS